MPPNVRTLPWLLALAGLAIPLVGSGFVVWPLVLVWLVFLMICWTLVRPLLPRERGPRIALALGLLPILFLTGWEGGWWLIPADLVWLAIELVGRDETAAAPPGRDLPI